MVVQQCQPWMSEVDIEAGSRWLADIEQGLAGCDVGLICVTPDNQLKPWLLFESGALAKHLTESRVVPLRYGLDPASSLLPPLSNFQSKSVTNQQEMLTVVQMLNDRCDIKVPADALAASLEALFSVLEKRLAAIPNVELMEPRSADNMLSEVLDLIRSVDRRVADIEAQFRPTRRMQPTERQPQQRRPSSYLTFTPELADIPVRQISRIATYLERSGLRGEVVGISKDGVRVKMEDESIVDVPLNMELLERVSEDESVD